VLPAHYVADIDDLHFELSGNRSALTITGRRTLPTISGIAISPLEEEHINEVLELPSAVTSVGLEATLSGHMLSLRVKKTSSKKLARLGEVGEGERKGKGKGKGEGEGEWEECGGSSDGGECGGSSEGGEGSSARASK
jgi:hypothetical protein